MFTGFRYICQRKMIDVMELLLRNKSYLLLYFSKLTLSQTPLAYPLGGNNLSNVALMTN